MSKFLHDDNDDDAKLIKIPQISPKTATLKKKKLYCKESQIQQFSENQGQITLDILLQSLSKEEIACY